MLALPRDVGDFVLDTHASEHAVGAVLSQIQDGEERVIAYFSRLYSETERNYCTTRKELLVVIESLRQFRAYIMGRHFIVRSDHSALRYLWRAPNLIGQQARWLNFLGEFDFSIEHRSGGRLGNADALCRRSCRSCVYCKYTTGLGCSAVGSEKTAQEETEAPDEQGEDAWSPAKLRYSQMKDPNLRPVIEWIETSVTVPE